MKGGRASGGSIGRSKGRSSLGYLGGGKGVVRG